MYLSALVLEVILIFSFSEFGETRLLKQLHRRIVGSRTALITDWPFAARLSFHQKEPPFKICSGALINRNYVLTAGHCVQDNPRDYVEVTKPESITVTLGSTLRKENSGSTYKVKRIIQHPLFKDINTKFMNGDHYFAGRINYDIALLELSTPAAVGPNVALADYHCAECVNDDEQEGEEEEVSGIDLKLMPTPGQQLGSSGDETDSPSETEEANLDAQVQDVEEQEDEDEDHGSTQVSISADRPESQAAKPELDTTDDAVDSEEQGSTNEPIIEDGQETKPDETEEEQSQEPTPANPPIGNPGTSEASSDTQSEPTDSDNEEDVSPPINSPNSEPGSGLDYPSASQPGTNSGTPLPSNSEASSSSADNGSGPINDGVSVDQNAQDLDVTGDDDIQASGEKVEQRLVTIEDTDFQDCQIAGWGKEQEFASKEEFGNGNYTPALELQQGSVKLLTKPSCKTYLKKSEDQIETDITDKVLCGTYKKQKTYICLGDSGSPLVCRKEGKKYLAGIAVFGNFLCSPDGGAMLFTKVKTYQSWIDSIINARVEEQEQGEEDDEELPSTVSEPTAINVEGEGSADDDDMPTEQQSEQSSTDDKDKPVLL